jgi:hypothetical protein
VAGRRLWARTTCVVLASQRVRRGVVAGVGSERAVRNDYLTLPRIKLIKIVIS